MKVINLTPHKVSLVSNTSPSAMMPGGPTETIQATYDPEPIPARCDQETLLDWDSVRKDGSVHSDGSWSVRIKKIHFGETHNLPDEESGTVNIVSHIVAEANNGRPDLYFPTELRRGEDGNITCAESLATVYEWASVNVFNGGENSETRYFKFDGEHYKCDSFAAHYLGSNPIGTAHCEKEEYDSMWDEFNYFWECQGSHGIMWQVVIDPVILREAIRVIA